LRPGPATRNRSLKAKGTSGEHVEARGAGGNELRSLTMIAARFYPAAWQRWTMIERHGTSGRRNKYLYLFLNFFLKKNPNDCV
jgi:hypothetical protein